MNRFSATLAAATAVAFALMMFAPVGARAMEPLIAKLADVDDAVKNTAPEFGCYDQTDKTTCQQAQVARISSGTFTALDFANGIRIRCFSPGFVSYYRVCSGGWDDALWPEISNSGHWIKARFSDSRCDQWGGPFSAEYLACEAALPPKSGG